MKLRLTQTKIRNLKPGPKRIDCFDEEISGLILRVETSGSKTWLVSQRIPGTEKRIYYTIGRWGETAITAEQARRKAQIIKQIIRENGAPPPPPEAALKTKSLTLGEIFEKYQPQLEENYRTERSQNGARLNIKRFQPDFWNKPASEIKPIEIASWQKKENEKLTASYLNKNLSALQVMLNWASDPLIGIMDENPIKGVKRLPETDSKEYQINLTEAEYKEFVKKLRERDSRKKDFWLPAVLLAVNTGLRKGTLFGIKWKNVDFNARRIALSPEIMKVKRKKRPEQDTLKFVYLNKEALEALKEWKNHYKTPPGGEELIFSCKQPRYQAWKKVRKEIGLPDGTRIHDLRHIFASRAVSAGISSVAGAQLLHQTTTELFRRYGHLSPDAALKMVDLIGKKEEEDEDEITL